MFNQIKQIIKENNRTLFKNLGVSLCKVGDKSAGFSLISNILYNIVDKKSVLYLSGGSTPKSLYEKLSAEESLTPGAVGMIDERFGPRFHKRSNELMVREAGLLRYLEILDIPFYPILQDGLTREDSAAEYDARLRTLQSSFQKHIGILGIGADGHTAGIAGNRPGFTNPVFDPSRKSLFVSEFDDTHGPFKERITLTFLGLSMLDVFLVLVFGAEKKHALTSMFDPGSEEEIPSRFYTRPDISPKTIIITDQEF